MKPNDYQKAAMRTSPEVYTCHSLLSPNLSDCTLFHASLGLAGEVGEFVGAVKKSYMYNQDVDWQNLKEELGDMMWYIALACDALDIKLEVVMEENIAKLKKRYPEKFTEYYAEARLDKE